MDDDAGGLFSITLSDSEPEETSKNAPPRDRTGQTFEEWQAIKETYRAKIENGDVKQKVTLPLPKGAKKPLIQEACYAAEELYFFRRYQEARDLLNEILSEQSEGAFDDATRKMLEMCRRRCEEKLSLNS